MKRLIVILLCAAIVGTLIPGVSAKAPKVPIMETVDGSDGGGFNHPFVPDSPCTTPSSDPGCGDHSGKGKSDGGKPGQGKSDGRK